MRWASMFMPLAVTLPMSGMPWWVYLLVGTPGVSICTAAYIYRLHGIYKLGAKALDKAEHSEIAAIMTTITGRTSMRATKTSRRFQQPFPQIPLLGTNGDPETDANLFWSDSGDPTNLSSSEDNA
jgi:hypothetical protein